MIPFGDLKRDYSERKEEINDAVNRVLKSGWFILGKELESFEYNFSGYCGKEYGIGVGNGTDAIKIALEAYGIGRGDEVITVPNTAIPTVSAICETGAKPVFVDVGKDYLIDVERIEDIITKKTKAIIPVHLYGQVCDMYPILNIARKNRINIIEDCAQAHGAEYKGMRVPIGEMGCFSFYPSKNLGAYGDGGMIVTSNKNLSEKLKMLRNYGQIDKYHAKIQGHNTRLDEIQSAILNEKLKYLDEMNETRRENALFYNGQLDDLLSNVITPTENMHGKHVYHLYVIKVKENERGELIEYLKQNEIGTGIHYPIPIHLQEAYKYLGYKEGDFPNTEKFSKEIISLPMFPRLREEEIKEVCDNIHHFSQIKK